MTEVVSSIRRVTDIMGEISASSNEQSQGVSQIGEAVNQMDRVTQQNAVLVEEMAAAASSLKGQAQEQVQIVAMFKLGDGYASSQTPKPVYAPQSKPVARAAQKKLSPAGSAATQSAMLKPGPAKPTPKALTKNAVLAKPSSAGGDEDWETF